jgi:hypothetical protein
VLLRFHVTCRHKSPLHNNLVKGSYIEYPRLRSLGEVGGENLGGPVLTRFLRMLVGVHWASSRTSAYIRVSERKAELISIENRDRCDGHCPLVGTVQCALASFSAVNVLSQRRPLDSVCNSAMSAQPVAHDLHIRTWEHA